MTGPAKVTVAITTYNQDRLLERTLESVFAQTRPPDEIVVVDDGSTDSTPGLLQRHRARIRIIQQRNRGVAAARNRAVSESTGDLIALLDGDDLWAPSKLQVCLDAAAAARAPVVVHGVQAMSHDEAQVAPGPIRDFLVRHTGAAARAHLDCWEALVDVNFIWTTSQVLIARRLYLDAGGSDPRFRIGSDYDLYLRLARRTPFLLIPDDLAFWRQHDASASGAGADRMLNWKRESIKVLRLQAARSEPVPAERLRQHAARSLAGLNRELYCEEQRGPLERASRLLRVARECRAPSSAVLAMAALFPYPVRHAVAVLSGRSVASALRSSSERQI
jgi:glycosyltransferase involved in cell wall biosynthesis